ncbi:MAG: inositol monophosphatase family protein [Acidimicrobiales bacterium]
MQADPPVRAMADDSWLMGVLRDAADAVRAAVSTVSDLRALGRRTGQYALDLVADQAACGVLHRAGLTVFSEESGLSTPEASEEHKGPTAPEASEASEAPEAPGHGTERGAWSPLVVVVDPVDGSTNASLGIPWFATSLCVLDPEGPRLALVVNQATGVRYEAVRRGGAWRDGQPITPSGCRRMADAVVGVSGLPVVHPGWAQFRALGAAALDLCLVAEGGLDGYRVAGRSTLAAWDYLGGLLVCTEAGAVAAEGDGLELVVRDSSPRRPVAAATPALLTALLAVPM